jgi:LmbE family N-acetylglucosaminyl deacetylase
MAFPWLARDGLAPHAVRRLYLFWSNKPSAWIDVSGTLQRKLDALRAHTSQLRHPEQLEPRIRAWAREEGEVLGVEAAEALRVVVIDEDPPAEEDGPGAGAAAEEASRGA